MPLDWGARPPDTVSNVVHQGAERRPGQRGRHGLVNNLAAGQIESGSRRFAPTLHGRSSPAPTRARLRSPVALGASGPTSERTAPHEGPRIRSRPFPTHGEASAATKGQRMKTWNELTHFAGAAHLCGRDRPTVWLVLGRSCSARGRAEPQPGRLRSPTSSTASFRLRACWWTRESKAKMGA